MTYKTNRIVKEMALTTFLLGSLNLNIGMSMKSTTKYEPLTIKNPISEVYNTEVENRLKEMEENYNKQNNKIPVSSEELELLTQMIYLEAGICSLEEKIAVGYTAINRFKTENEKSLGDVLMKPLQYSCFNNLDKNEIIKKRDIAKKEDNSRWNECEDIAKKISYGEYIDPTNGATHYYNPGIIKKPKWKMNSLEKIGKINTKNGESEHIFFREKLSESNLGG
jgi:spore germination cell wall hydrolase CwlJ-like protein